MELTTNFINELLLKANNYPTDVYNNPISNIAKNWSTISENPYLFNHEIETDFKITDQKSSGRCWLFATLNLLRFIAASSWSNLMDIKELEFSQSYLYFWDKFERYNMNLYYYIDILKKNDDIKCHYINNMCKDPLGDGGQWDMAKELVIKYGVVPKYVYPDSYHAKNSAVMNKILTEMLKQDWLILEKCNEESRGEYISKAMEKVFHVLVKFLGKPPNKFNFEFKHKSKVLIWENLTPLKLLEKTGFKPDNWVSIVHDPRIEHSYGKYYQVEYLGNIKKQHVGWLNLPMNRVMELTQRSILNKKPVWFGCDVGSHRDKDTGIQDLDIIDYKKSLDILITLNKESRLRLYHSVPSHAMVITGYHKLETDSEVRRWKVENSWGSTSGTNGFLLMTSNWFKEYVFQIVVEKDLLNEEELKELQNVHKIISPWDPLGTLA
jgi:bleomycin hydrolase